MCKLTYKVQQNEDIADVTDANYRNWLLGRVKINITGIKIDGTIVAFDLWRFYATGNDAVPNAQCLYGINDGVGYFRNLASENDTIRQEYHPHNLTHRNEIITEWMIRENINHVVVKVIKDPCIRINHNAENI